MIRPSLLLCLAATCCALDHAVVDWDRVGGTVSPLHFGVNLWNGLDPTVAADERYREGLRHLAPGIVRYHAAEQLGDGRQSWVDHAAKTWDRARIAAALEATDDLLPAQRILTICGWPDWMAAEGSGRLDPAKLDAYAAFCAELVTIVNGELGLDVPLWEPFNEIENRYKDDPTQLGTIFAACAAAMRAADPTIKIGGAAWTHPYQQEAIHAFLAHAGPVDFISYHHYGSGDKQAEEAELLDAALGLAGGAHAMHVALREAGHQDLPVYLDEHNTFWTWKADHERKRMASMTGALFDALSTTALIRGGHTQGHVAWNDSDGTYGKMSSGDFALRPAGHFYHLANHHLIGDWVLAQTTCGDAVTAFAVDAGEHRALLLINRGDERELRLLQADQTDAPSRWTRFTIAGPELRRADEEAAPLSVPARSLTLLRWPPLPADLVPE